MKRIKRLLTLALSCLMLVSLLASCGNSAETNSNPPEGGDPSGAEGRVYWLNFKPESDGALLQIAEMYQNKTGVPVKIVTAASGTYSQTLNAEMGKSEAPTIFVVGNQAGVRDWTDYALDLKGTAIEAELNTDAYNLYDENGKLVSIGYCYECYGIIVNPDLLEQAGHSLDEIKNFDTLKTVVEDIHARAAELGFDAFTSCDMDGSSSWRFTGHMANLEYYYEQEGSVWTECPPTITGKYLDNFKNLYDLCINNSLTDPKELSVGGHDPLNEFNTGKAAFYVNGSWAYSGESGVSDAVPNATMIPYYCGVAGEEKAGLNVGTENYWAINNKVSEADQKATMDFMMWCVTDPEASRMLVDTFGVMPYKQAQPSTNAFLAAAEKYSADGCYSMNAATNFQPDVDNYRAAMVSALNQYNADQSDANWELFRIAFVDGWAQSYQNANG